jgi:uncharacterized protein (DUF169 family)
MEGVSGVGKYVEVSRRLHEALKLSVVPIAVSIVESIPDGVPPVSRRLAAGCMFWQEAANGPIATSASDHELCAIGVYTHNLANPPASFQSELGDVLKVMADMTYVRPEDVAQIPVLRRQASHVIYAPLAQAPVDPDVVLLFVDSRQGLIITEAVQQVDPDTPPALGRPACAVVPQAINTGRAALSLGCCGARAYLNALTDEIALWALPGPRLSEYTERIVTLASANATLTKFHEQRLKDVESGLAPTYRESLGRM